MTTLFPSLHGPIIIQVPWGALSGAGRFLLQVATAWLARMRTLHTQYIQCSLHTQHMHMSSVQPAMATSHRLDRLGAVAEGHATSEWHDMAEPVPRGPLCRATAACRAAWVHLVLALGQQSDNPRRNTIKGFLRLLLVRL